MYETILIPTDGSDHAIRAVEHGQYLARRFDATVHVINVVDVQAAAGAFSAGGIGEEFIGRLEAEGKNIIETIEAAVGEIASMQTAILRGKPSEAIIEYADTQDADLIAMGTHGRTGVNRYLAGSVTERVVRLANCPVLTVRATDRSRIIEDYDEILIPTDGSEPATAAIDHGLAIAAQTEARVHTVNIVDVGDIVGISEYTPPTEVIEQLEAEGETATDMIAAQAQDRGLDAVTAIRDGLPARDILEYADEHDIDLIAMGTTGQTGINRYLLGSTTERIIRHAEIPTLAVNVREQVVE